MENVFSYSVYTMKKGQDLELASSQNKGSFMENKAWKEGQKLLHQAQELGQHLPILFSLAEENSGVAYIAYAESIKITDEQRTQYSFTDIRKLKNSKPLSS